MTTPCPTCHYPSDRPGECSSCSAIPRRTCRKCKAVKPVTDFDGDKRGCQAKQCKACLKLRPSRVVKVNDRQQYEDLRMTHLRAVVARIDRAMRWRPRVVERGREGWRLREA